MKFSGRFPRISLSENISSRKVLKMHFLADFSGIRPFQLFSVGSTVPGMHQTFYA
jgi:hypothetical protein